MLIETLRSNYLIEQKDEVERKYSRSGASCFSSGLLRKSILVLIKFRLNSGAPRLVQHTLPTDKWARALRMDLKVHIALSSPPSLAHNTVSEEGLGRPAVWEWRQWG